MFQANELKAELTRKNLSTRDLANHLEINLASLYKKMNGTSDFYRHEITSIREFLGLSNDDVIRIFFAH